MRIVNVVSNCYLAAQTDMNIFFKSITIRMICNFSERRMANVTEARHHHNCVLVKIKAVEKFPKIILDYVFILLFKECRLSRTNSFIEIFVFLLYSLFDDSHDSKQIEAKQIPITPISLLACGIDFIPFPLIQCSVQLLDNSIFAYLTFLTTNF